MHSEDWLAHDSKNKYIREHTKLFGHDLYAIDESDLVIQIFKEQSMAPEAMGEKIQEAMQKGLENPDAMDEMMAELEAMMSGGNKKEFPVRVMVRLNQVKLTKVETHNYREVSDRANPPDIRDEDGSMEMIIIPTLAWLMEGTYYKDDEGYDRIVATLDESRLSESGDKDCHPQGSYTNSWSFELRRIRVK